MKNASLENSERRDSCGEPSTIAPLTYSGPEKRVLRDASANGTSTDGTYGNDAPGDCDPLPLPAAQHACSLTDLCVIAVW